jgi:hypothetical protein
MRPSEARNSPTSGCLIIILNLCLPAIKRCIHVHRPSLLLMRMLCIGSNLVHKLNTHQT